LRRCLDLRYEGEVHEVTVPLKTRTRRVTALNIEATLRAFHDQHEALFAHKDATQPIELLTIRIDMLGLREPPKVTGADFGEEDAGEAIKNTRPITFADGTHDANVYDGAKLRAGHFLSGPAAIENWGTTIIVCPGQEALIDTYGNCIIENGGQA
jgi:N-methylhydantoinase A